MLAQNQYQVWSTNADAVIQRFSSWKTASQMMEEGYETTFNTDFNDDGVTGVAYNGSRRR